MKPDKAKKIRPAERSCAYAHARANQLKFDS
jgi:hypothetical protein